ncbi:MAG: hypothetical protein ACRKGH_00630 [Dehalogenimonas sp.]
MSNMPSLTNALKTLKEVDLNTIRNQAEAPFHVAVIGAPGTGKSTLLKQLLAGPGIVGSSPLRPISEQLLNEETLIRPGSVVILMLDARESELPLGHRALDKLRSYQVPIIACYNKLDLVQDQQLVSNEEILCLASEVIAFSAIDNKSVLQNLIPALLHAYEGREMLLARNLPMLREPVSRKLIDDTCFINASYSLATGIAEINILLTMPVNVADIIVLTKNQALMSYKIALACGLSSDWRQTIPKLVTVISSAFLWRSITRQLVGLLPVIGIIPKIAVSYAGTYTIGQAIYQWCANGVKVKPGVIGSLYTRALKKGREVARTLVAKRRVGSHHP